MYVCSTALFGGQQLTSILVCLAMNALLCGACGVGVVSGVEAPPTGRRRRDVTLVRWLI